MPNLNIVPSTIGKDAEISLQVMDERPKQIIGHRGTAYGAAAEITTNQNVEQVIKEKLVEGLIAKGFKVVPNATSIMKVEIRLIEYTTSTGFWTGGVHLRATLKGICKTVITNYEKLYRRENEERVVVVPTAETNEGWINKVVSEVLDEIVNDEKMLNCLIGNAA